MHERSMIPPSLNLSSVTSLERRSTAEGMVGSVSPRPTEKKRLASSVFDEGLADEGDAPSKSRGRSPSQPILSLLEHEEQIRRYASRKSLSTSSERPWGGNEIEVKGMFVSGMLVSEMTTEEREGCVRQNSIRTISSVAACDRGEYLAIGDRSGRVFVMRKDNQDTFGYFIGKQCYTPVIDPLNSVEVTPLVSSVGFLPQYGPTSYLLTSNEKVPKLYKIMPVRDTPQPPKAVSLIGTKMVGPLTSPQRTSTTAMKQVHHYAMDHEYNIHSVCPVSDGSQFYSVDDLAVRLWCVDHPLSSIEVFSLKSRQQDGESRELIRKGFLFDNEPGLFFMTTSCGAVRVVDARESLRWVDRDPLIFHCPPRLVEDGPFAELTNNISSCALSPCGRYLCARDFMSATLWDIRKSSADVVGRWEVHSHLRPHLDALYQSELLLERFDVKFISSSHIATGSFSNTLCLIDSLATSNVVKKYQLPNLTDGRVSRVQQMEELTETPHFGEGSRVTALTSVIPSSDNRYEIGVACGESLVHIAL